MPSIYGDFQVIGFQSLLDDSDYVALVKGNWDEKEPVLVRVHSECLTGDVFGSYRCDCGPQLHVAMESALTKGQEQAASGEVPRKTRRTACCGRWQQRGNYAECAQCES